MKHTLFIILVILLACILSNTRGCKPLKQMYNGCVTYRDTITIYKTDTIIKIDTIIRHYPQPYMVCVTDTIHVTDTILLREQKTYKDSTYTAWVSGYDPILDSIEVYPKTITIREEISNEIQKIPKKKHFGFGVQIGYGYPHGAYIGVGFHYNLINF